jgi:hypothetical protein
VDNGCPTGKISFNGMPDLKYIIPKRIYYFLITLLWFFVLSAIIWALYFTTKVVFWTDKNSPVNQNTSAVPSVSQSASEGNNMPNPFQSLVSSFERLANFQISVTASTERNQQSINHENQGNNPVQITNRVKRGWSKVNEKVPNNQIIFCP